MALLRRALPGWSAALLLASIVVGGCSDDPSTEEDAVGDVVDTRDSSDQLPTDSADHDTFDACRGVDATCDAAGSRCDGDQLIVCGPNADGCLVELAIDCTQGTTDTCDDTIEPDCVAIDPCAGSSDCSTAGRACEGANLVVCAPDENGCLVATTTDCADGDTNACSADSVPACVFDPCLDADGNAPADACTSTGSACDSDTLTVCRVDAFGCLVATATDCVAGGGTACDATASPATCATTAPCPTACEAGTRCQGNNLVTCAADAFGCLVESSTACDTATGGFCDRSGSAAACAIDPADRCEGKATCDDPGATCDGDQLELCGYDTVGCLLPVQIDCSAAGLTCGDGPAGQSTCVRGCEPDPACAAASEGDGWCGANGVETCTDLDGDGCLELAVNDCGALPCLDDGVSLACATAGDGADCASPLVLSGGSLVLTGENFVADFTDDLVFTDVSCMAGTDPDLQELVVQVHLLAGEAVTVSDSGPANVTFHVQRACGASEVCVVSDFSGFGAEPEGVGYVATVEETIFVIVQASVSEAAFAYHLAITRPTCGDGVVEVPERCDDANDQTGDGCDGCALETGWTCDNTATSVCTAIPSIGTFAAGDTIPDTVGGNLAGGDEDLYAVTFTTDVMLSGVLTAPSGDPDLAVFDGAGAPLLNLGTMDGEEWQGLDLPAGVYVLRVLAYGTNGVDGYTLSLSTAGVTCGDSQVRASESCDDGNVSDGDGCSELCQTESGWSCPQSGGSCHAVVCGDGVIDGAETCDDGDTAAADGCAADCTLETGYTCSGQPSFCYTTSGDTCAAVITLPGPGLYTFDPASWQNDVEMGSGPCGPSMYVGPEGFFAFELASGAFLDVTPLSPDLELFAAFDCATAAATCVGSTAMEPLRLVNLASTPTTVTLVTEAAPFGPLTFAVDVYLPTCGDGVVEGLETCDDRNAGSLDGCDANCQVEAGYVCRPVGVACYVPTCGDGHVDAPEVCDDGNVVDSDGCAGDCSGAELGFECWGEPSLCTTASGATCDVAIVLPGPGSYAFDTAGRGEDTTGYLGACSTTGVVAAGPDLVLAIAVADGDLLDVVAVTDGSDALVVLAGACPDLVGSCLDRLSGTPLSARYYNDTGALATVYLVLDGAQAAVAHPYGLSIDVRTPTCGDGAIDLAEVCDDGNLDTGDGCSATCAIESGHVCAGEPSSCNQGLHISQTANLAIPDNNPTGVFSVIQVTGTCTVASIEVDVDVAHPYVGDLVVQLAGPDGTTVSLHNRTGGATDNLVGTYPTTLTPAQSLAAFVGSQAQGTWTLTASDRMSSDVGTLRTWGLGLVCQ